MSTSRERFSGGHVASIYKVSDDEKALFSRADLVRVDRVADPSWFTRLYYKHKVASLLYPDNFIEVVGARAVSLPLLVPTQTRQSEEIQNHNLYSQMAKVNPDHATYADHLTLVVGEGKLYKDFTCSCVACVRHGQEHDGRDMAKLAQEASDFISPSGIVPPTDDPGDYCLTDRGVIFFELKSFDPIQLKKSLTILEGIAPNQQVALSLLDRYIALDIKARLEAMKGKPVGLRHTS